MKIALVYDRVNKWGGAERVLLALNELFPNAPLYTSVYNSSLAPWAKVFPKVIPSFLQKIPFVRDKHEYLALVMPLAFESFSFDEYDLVISLSSEAAKGILTKPNTFHLNYCLTPTRYLWSGYDTYFENNLIKRLVSPIVFYLRKWDRTASYRPDVIISISQEVKSRVKKYYGRESKVLYPPITISDNQSTYNNVQLGNYFLVVSRLVAFKRIDLAIEAFNQLRLTLLIVGKGREEHNLRKISKINIKFLGELTDSELESYYRRCQALIISQKEDFGLAALEAQLMGRPVIAFDSGGVKETVINGTGILFKRQSKDSIIEAVRKFQKIKFNSRDCVKNAKRFSKEKFKKNFLEIIKIYQN